MERGMLCRVCSADAMVPSFQARNIKEGPSSSVRKFKVPLPQDSQESRAQALIPPNTLIL